MPLSYSVLVIIATAAVDFETYFVGKLVVVGDSYFSIIKVSFDLCCFILELPFHLALVSFVI
jgi:hypothetical protein